MTSVQVVETSVTTTDNSPSQDYTHPDDQTTLLHVNPRVQTIYWITVNASQQLLSSSNALNFAIDQET